MSKIKVDEIESSSSNVKLSPKGTGLVKVKAAGGADGTLQLTSGGGTHAVKIKSPPHSAGQSHTMILPDNNAVAGGHLHVKSVTGSGATAVGQLEFKTFATVDTSNMATSSFTTGKLPGSALPTQTAANGAALKLVSNSVLTTTASYIEFADLAEENYYYIVGKKLIPTSSGGAAPYISFYDIHGNQSFCNYRMDYGYTTSRSNNNYTSQSKVPLEYQDKSTYWTNGTGIFTMDLSVGKSNDFARCYFFISLGEPSDNTTSYFRANGHRLTNYGNAWGRVRIYVGPNAGNTWAVGTEIQLFQYLKT